MALRKSIGTRGSASTIRHSVGKLEGVNVERIGAAMFAQGRAAHPVAAAAFVGAEIFDLAQRRTEFHGGRRHVVADPLHDLCRHRAAQRRGRRNRHFRSIRHQQAVQQHGIRSATFSRRDQRPERAEARNLGQLRIAIRRRRRLGGFFLGQRSECLLRRRHRLRNGDRPRAARIAMGSLHPFRRVQLLLRRGDLAGRKERHNGEKNLHACTLTGEAPLFKRTKPRPLCASRLRYRRASG